MCTLLLAVAMGWLSRYSVADEQAYHALTACRARKGLLTLIKAPSAFSIIRREGLILIQQVLAQISAEVFLIPQRGNQQGNMLQDLMGSLFGGGGGGAPAIGR